MASSSAHGRSQSPLSTQLIKPNYLINKQFLQTAVAEGIDSNPADFVSLSLGAMKVLQVAGKPNLIYKWSKCVFGDDGKPLIPLHRMPFGLIQYQMEFFTCTNVMQVTNFNFVVLYYLAKHISILLSWFNACL